MNKIIEDNRDELIEILKRHHIKEAYLFGSVIKDNFNNSSDIDLLVQFDPIIFNGYAENLWNLEEKLQNLFERKVDVIPEHTLKNPYFIKEVQKNRIKIYG
jgi:uncharacterized protein